MYLTGGQYKGYKIESAKNARSTLSKVRESVFNILQQYSNENKYFLDMFAGSGIMGIEALSRGYIVKHIEINPKNASIIKNNYKKLNITPDITICNSLNYTDNKLYDVIYLDPPWDMDYAPVIKKAEKLLSQKGVIVVEFDQQQNIDIKKIITEQQINLEVIKSKKYGRCLINLLSRLDDV